MIGCLCGSTHFARTFEQANLEETLKGNIVLTIGCRVSDEEVFYGLSKEKLEFLKDRLDQLHKRKIDLCDEVLVLNVNNYIGDSTRSEIEYAEKIGKPVLYWCNHYDVEMEMHVR